MDSACGWLAQPAERVVHTDEVTGSSPVPPTPLARQLLDTQSRSCCLCCSIRAAPFLAGLLERLALRRLERDAACAGSFSDEATIADPAKACRWSWYLWLACARIDHCVLDNYRAGDARMAPCVQGLDDARRRTMACHVGNRSGERKATSDPGVFGDR